MCQDLNYSKEEWLTPVLGLSDTSSAGSSFIPRSQSSSEATTSLFYLTRIIAIEADMLAWQLADQCPDTFSSRCAASDSVNGSIYLLSTVLLRSTRFRSACFCVVTLWNSSVNFQSSHRFLSTSDFSFDSANCRHNYSRCLSNRTRSESQPLKRSSQMILMQQPPLTSTPRLHRPEICQKPPQFLWYKPCQQCLASSWLPLLSFSIRPLLPRRHLVSQTSFTPSTTLAGTAQHSS